jgi:hypothetical protein
MELSLTLQGSNLFPGGFKNAEKLGTSLLTLGYSLYMFVSGIPCGSQALSGLTNIFSPIPMSKSSCRPDASSD